MSAAVCWLNQVSIAALTVGAFAANAGPNNLQLDQGAPSVAWQTPGGVLTDAAGAWLLIDSGTSATIWRIFGLFRTNLTAAATVRWRVGNALTGGRISGTLAYDSGTISAAVAAGYLQSIVMALANVTGRYCEVDINDPTNPDGFINIPLVYAGPAFIPSTGITPDSTVGRSDQTDEFVSLGGQE